MVALPLLLEKGMHKDFVIMGVSGCGKSEVAERLAQALRVPFIEGDQYHSVANVARMAAGIALTDADRAAWLAELQQALRQARERAGGAVLSCSSLKRRYRDFLRAGVPSLRFVHLDGPRDLIAARMQARGKHFMPLSLLGSQLAALEPLAPDEDGLLLDIRPEPQVLVDAIVAAAAH